MAPPLCRCGVADSTESDSDILRAGLGGRVRFGDSKQKFSQAGAGQEAENIGGGRRPERAGKAVAEGGGGSGSARRAASRRDKGAKGQTLVKTVLNKYSTTYSTSTQQPTQQPTQQVTFVDRGGQTSK